MNTYYQVELIWNREFHFVTFGDPYQNLDHAIRAAKDAESMGDGDRVKETRIIDQDGKVIWQYGKLTTS